MTMEDFFSSFDNFDNFFDIEEPAFCIDWLDNGHEANQSDQDLQEAARFDNLSNEEIRTMKEKCTNKNTAKTMKTWINTYFEWAKQKHQREDIENIPPSELNLILEQFYAEFRKKDKTVYEPESLAVMQASIDALIRGTEFYSSNLTLKGKAAQLRESGKGSRPNASKPLTKLDENKLWEEGKLGQGDPETLIRTVWFFLMQYLGFRGRQEHKIAEIEDFEFGVDENNAEYVEYNDCKPTKTRPGAVRAKRRSQRPRMYATNTDRCPVAIFKTYLARRPKELREKGPLYLSTISTPTSEVWYKRQKMGVNRIGEMMKRIIAGTSIEGEKRLTNHSGRKTLIKKLDDASVPRNKITVIGHRNEKSLDDYVDSMNHKQSRKLSNIISGEAVALDGCSKQPSPSSSSVRLLLCDPLISLSGKGSHTKITINVNTQPQPQYKSPDFCKPKFKKIHKIESDDDSSQ